MAAIWRGGRESGVSQSLTFLSFVAALTALLMEQTYNAPHPDMAGLAIVAVVVLFILVIAFAIQAVICYFIADHYRIIPQDSRKMEPGQVWLLMIPLFNIYWVFPVFLGLSESYQTAFARRGRTDLGDCSRQVALWYCICLALCIIPCLNYIAGPAALVLLILYLVQISDYKRQLIALG